VTFSVSKCFTKKADLDKKCKTASFSCVLVTVQKLQDSSYRSRFVNAAHKFALRKSRIADCTKVPVCSSGCTKALILLLHCICPEYLGFLAG